MLLVRIQTKCMLLFFFSLLFASLLHMCASVYVCVCARDVMVSLISLYCESEVPQYCCGHVMVSNDGSLWQKIVVLFQPQWSRAESSSTQMCWRNKGMSRPDAEQCVKNSSSKETNTLSQLTEEERKKERRLFSSWNSQEDGPGRNWLPVKADS